MDFLNKFEIWCICLLDRDDRYYNAVNEFKAIGILNLVNFHRPTKDTRGGIVGCFLSHKYCINQSLKKGKPVLIFEDDVEFTDDYIQGFNDINNFLLSGIEWDIIKLGCMLTSLHKKIFKNIWLSKSNATHAIFYNFDTMNLIDNYTINPNKIEHIDVWLLNNTKLKEVSLENHICYQKNGFKSDINWYTGNTKYLQMIVQNYGLYKILQKLQNNIIWYVRFLPIKYQEYINIFPA